MHPAPPDPQRLSEPALVVEFRLGNGPAAAARTEPGAVDTVLLVRA